MGLQSEPPSFAFEFWRNGGSIYRKAVADRHRVKVRIAKGYLLKGPCEETTVVFVQQLGVA